MVIRGPIGCTIDFRCRLLHLEIILLKKPSRIALCNKALLQIKSIVKFPIHNTWINDDVGRSLLFLKLELADFHDHLYLIDIKKNNKNNEAFCFFLFTTKEMLNEKNITMICEASEGKKGTKKWFDICKTNFNQKRAMKHMHTVQSDWIDSFSKIFNTLIKKKKL